MVGLYGTGIVSDQQETSRLVGIEEGAHKHVGLSYGSVVRTLLLVPGSCIEESRCLEGCRQQDID